MKKQTTKNGTRKERRIEPGAAARVRAGEPGLPGSPPGPISVSGPTGYFTPSLAERGHTSKKKPELRERKQNKIEETSMNEHVYKIIELTGTSSQSLEGAIQNAIARAAQTVRQMRWFQVTETRGSIEDNKIAHWQVTVKIGFTLED
jgi:hypothetical protein